jgi:hypothetical protein
LSIQSELFKLFFNIASCGINDEVLHVETQTRSKTAIYPEEQGWKSRPQFAGQVEGYHDDCIEFFNQWLLKDYDIPKYFECNTVMYSIENAMVNYEPVAGADFRAVHSTNYNDVVLLKSIKSEKRLMGIVFLMKEMIEIISSLSVEFEF